MEQYAVVATIYDLARLYIRLSSVGVVSAMLASDEQFMMWVNLLVTNFPPVPSWPLNLRLEFVLWMQERGVRFALTEPEIAIDQIPTAPPMLASETLPALDSVVMRNGHTPAREEVRSRAWQDRMTG